MQRPLPWHGQVYFSTATWSVYMFTHRSSTPVYSMAAVPQEQSNGQVTALSRRDLSSDAALALGLFENDPQAQADLMGHWPDIKGVWCAPPSARALAQAHRHRAPSRKHA